MCGRLRHRWNEFVLIVGIGLIVFSILSVLQSYNGRVDIVNSARTACRDGSVFKAAVANLGRLQQQANVALEDLKLPKGAHEIIRQAAEGQNAALHVIDEEIDSSAWSLLDPMERAYVETLGVHAFSCDQVYPPASIRIG